MMNEAILCNLIQLSLHFLLYYLGSTRSIYYLWWRLLLLQKLCCLYYYDIQELNGFFHDILLMVWITLLCLQKQLSQIHEKWILFLEFATKWQIEKPRSYHSYLLPYILNIYIRAVRSDPKWEFKYDQHIFSCTITLA